MSQYATQPFNYSPFGIVAGLLAPYLAKQFGGSSSSAPAPGVTPSAAPSVAPNMPAAAPAASPLLPGANGIWTDPATGATSDIPGAIDPKLIQQAQAAAAPAAPAAGFGDKLSTALGSLGGSNTGMGSTSSAPTPLGPAVPPAPQGGGGVSPGVLQSANSALNHMLPPAFTGQGNNSNPLLAMLMQRLGSFGGL